MSENPRTAEMWVDPINGGFYYHVIDFKIRCRASSLVLDRYYNSINENSNNAPWDKWVFSYDERLRFEEPYSDSSVTVIYPNSYEDRFEKNPDGSFRPTTSKNRRSLCRNQDNTYTLSFPDGSRHFFRFGDGRLLKKEDVHGNTFTFEWTPLPTYPVLTVTPWDIRSITDPSGRKMEISYGNLGTERSLEFRWQGVRIVTYIFSFPHGNLKRVIDPEGNQVSYEYGSETPWTFEFPGLKKITLPNGVWVENFSAGPRPLSVLVGRQLFGNGREIKYTYDRKNLVTTIEDMNRIVVYRYDSSWNITSVTNQEGYTTRYEYSSERYIERIIDSRLGVWSYTHDSRGNVTSITNPMGHSTQYEYHPVFDELVRIIGPGPESRVYTIALNPVTGDVLSTTDPLGATVSTVYDAYGQVTEMRYPSGNAETYSYDVYGNLSSRSDSLARAYGYSYNGVGRPVSASDPLGTSHYEWWNHGMIKKITDPLGNSSSFEHDGCCNLTKFTDPLGKVTLLQYDRMNSLTRIINALGETLAFEYNLFVEMTRIITPRGHAYSYEYDRLSRVESIEAPDGTKTSISYAAFCGDTTITDARGNSRRILRDLLCRVTRVIPDLQEPTAFFTLQYNAYNELTKLLTPLGSATTITHNRNGKPVTITNALGDTIQLSYDGSDNLISMVDPKGNSTLFARDIVGRLTAVTDPEGGTRAFFFDGTDNLTGTIDPLGNLWEASYDVAGRLNRVSSPMGNTTVLALDAAGNIVSATDALGNSVQFSYDSLNRLIAVTDPLGNVTRLSFDANGNLVTMTNPLGNVVRFNYDSLDRPASTIDAEGGIVHYSHDPVGNLSALTDPKGNTTSYTYDRRNRPTAEIFADNTRSEAAYDADDNLVEVKTPRSENILLEYNSAHMLRKVTFPDIGEVLYDYDRNGNRTTMRDATGETSFSFDKKNRLTAKVNPDGKSIRYAYDLADNLTTITYPDGSSAVYEYDKAMRTTKLTDGAGQQATYSYNAIDQVARVDNSNGTYSLMSHDAAGRLSSLRHFDQAGSALAPSQELTYDAAGNLLSIMDGGTTLWTYQYDRSDRLISATNSAGETTGYAYDPAGNMTTRTLPDLSVIQYAYNHLNQLVSAGDYSFLYDAAGNLFKKIGPDGATTFNFNSDGRLTGIMHPDRTRSAFTYNADWELVKKMDRSGSIARYLWSGLDKVAEYDDNGLQAKYFYGLGLATSIKGHLKRFFHADYLGSVVRLTDQQGAATDSYAFGPWGEPLTSSGNTPNDFRFVGSYGVEWNDEAQLYYMRARWYDAELGRFMSRDPIGPFEDSSNLYQYCRDCPMTRIDPTGTSFDVTYKDGTKDSAQNSAKILRILREAKKGSISRISISGEGNQWSQGFILGEETEEDIWRHIDSSNNEQILITLIVNKKTGQTRDLNIIPLLKDKFAPGATIFLNGCNITAEEDNLAKSFSKFLPKDVTVFGSMGLNFYLDMAKVLDGIWGKKKIYLGPIGSGYRGYSQGKMIIDLTPRAPDDY